MEFLDWILRRSLPRAICVKATVEKNKQIP